MLSDKLIIAFSIWLVVKSNVQNMLSSSHTERDVTTRSTKRKMTSSFSTSFVEQPRQLHNCKWPVFYYILKTDFLFLNYLFISSGIKLQPIQFLVYSYSLFIRMISWFYWMWNWIKGLAHGTNKKRIQTTFNT